MVVKFPRASISESTKQGHPLCQICRNHD